MTEQNSLRTGTLLVVELGIINGNFFLTAELLLLELCQKVSNNKNFV